MVNSTLKDPATNDISRGWCRLGGLAPILIFLAAATVARNLRVSDAFDTRAADDARRLAAGMAPRTRRRKSGADALGAAPGAPP